MFPLAILIPSCDFYSDLWPSLIQSVERFWAGPVPDIYLVSNFQKGNTSLVKFILVGDDVSWSDNLLLALKTVTAKYVLLWIDDLVLTRPLEWDSIEKKIGWFFEEEGNYLRLNPTPPGVNRRRAFSEVPPGSLYRSSTVFSIWKKTVLEAVLAPGENPWQFEISGSVRTDQFAGWYASNTFLVHYANLVVKGKINPSVLNQIRSAGVNYHGIRPVMSPRELMEYRLRKIRFRAYRFFPAKFRRSVKAWFN